MTVHTFQQIEVRDNELGIHWFGQNSYAFKDRSGTIVQVDPYFPLKRPPEKYIHGEPPLDEKTLRTDFVLLTHNHTDHTCIESIQRIHAAFPDCRFIGPRESVDNMLAHGIADSRITRMEAGESLRMNGVTAHAFWSKPEDGAPEENIPKPDMTHLGYVMEIGGIKVCVTGDLINTFAEHDELIEPVAARKPDLGIITMHPTEGEFPFFEGSVRMAVKLGLKWAMPSHYGCFVKRTYDPHRWAALLPEGGPKPIIIPYNTHTILQSTTSIPE